MSVELDSPWSTAPASMVTASAFFPSAAYRIAQNDMDSGGVRVILSNDALQTVVVFTGVTFFRLRVVSFGGQYLAQRGLPDQRVGVVLAQVRSSMASVCRLSCSASAYSLVPKHIGKAAGGHQRGTVLRTQFSFLAGKGLAEHLLCLSVVLLSDEGEAELPMFSKVRGMVWPKDTAFLLR